MSEQLLGTLFSFPLFKEPSQRFLFCVEKNSVGLRGLFFALNDIFGDLTTFQKFSIFIWGENLLFQRVCFRFPCSHVFSERASMLSRLCLVPRPHYSARPKRVGSRGPRENVRQQSSKVRDSSCCVVYRTRVSHFKVKNTPLKVDSANIQKGFKKKRT